MSAVCHDSHALRALRAAGATYREIADLTGLSLAAINWRLNGSPRAALTVKPRRSKAACQERKCLTCGKPFASEGPHNRMCDSCRRKSASPLDIPATLRYRERSPS